MSECIVVTGPDGSGKSRVIKEWLEKLRGEGIQAVGFSIWDGLATQKQFGSKGEALAYLMGLQGWARVHFLLHGLAILSQLIEKAQAEVILVDGYWYKYYLSESLYQPELSLSPSSFEYCVVPDQVLYLETSLEQVMCRKSSWSRYECGGKASSPFHFIHFQKKLREQWREWVKAHESWERVNGDVALDQVITQCHEKVMLSLGPGLK